MTIGVRPAQKADVRPLSVVLARAFHDDPVMTWMLPDAGRRATTLPRMFATMTRWHFLALGGAEVATRGECIGGATLWDPPGRWKTTRRQNLMMLPSFIRAFGFRSRRSQQVADLMKEMHPDEPHWYLMVIGTDPSVRGAGLGQALMRSRLERCDAEYAPAYLEATKPHLVLYYSRFGFEVTGEVKLPDGGPSMWSMWRDPR